MSSILTGIQAIEAYKELQSSYPPGRMPLKRGYFTSDDYEAIEFYDSGTIVAFDSTTGEYFEDVFSTVNEALEWL